MEEEVCFRCERSGKEVRLFDAIYENEIVKVCEKCSITENLLVIRKPTTSQLRDSEKSYTVYQRMKILAGLNKKEKKTETISMLDQIRRIEKNPELEIPEEKKPFNLVDNFHWQIARARRNKGLSQRQLGWALGESEAAIKMIEKAELPEDSEMLIKKLEQFFQIKLRERTEQELEEEKRKRESREKFKIKPLEKELEFEETKGPIKPLISELELEELDVVSAIASGKLAGENVKREEIDKPGPARILNFKPEIMNNLSIADLKRMKEEREGRKAEKEEKKEESSFLKRKTSEKEEKEKSEEEKRKIGIREKVVDEMKDVALGKSLTMERKEPKRAPTKERTPTIYELMERKREKDRGHEKMIGDEVELEE